MDRVLSWHSVYDESQLSWYYQAVGAYQLDTIYLVLPSWLPGSDLNTLALGQWEQCAIRTRCCKLFSPRRENFSKKQKNTVKTVLRKWPALGYLPTPWRQAICFEFPDSEILAQNEGGTKLHYKWRRESNTFSNYPDD